MPTFVHYVSDFIDESGKSNAIFTKGNPTFKLHVRFNVLLTML